MTTEIRQAKREDVPALLKLIEEYWLFEGIAGFEPPRLTIPLERLLTSTQLGCGWIASIGDTPVGYLLAVYVFSLEHGGLTAEIDEFFVQSQYRGQKVGLNLLQVAELTFIRAGCTNIALQLARGNNAARAFYSRQGYQERSGYELLDKKLII